jgi:YVTN family beta-propeller protein
MNPPQTPDERAVRAKARASRITTLLSTSGDEAATSLLPGFLAGTLGAAPLALGLVEGVASAADGVARLGGGALSEDPRRRRVVSVVGSAGMALLAGLTSIASASWQVGALRSGAAASRGLRSPQRYASVPDRVGSDSYGRLFGVERSLHHLAAVAGPLMAFVLLALVGVRSAMLAAMVPGLLAVAIGVRGLRRNPRPAAAASSSPARLHVRAVYRGPLGRLMTGITLFELANFAAVLLILRATKLLEEGSVPFGAPAMAVLLYMLWRLAAAGSSVFAGRLVDRFGPAPVMTAGISALLASYAGFALVDGTIAALAACFAGAGASSGAIEAAEHVGVAQIAPEPLRWSAFGSLSAIRSFGRLTATIGASAVWTLLGPEFGLLFATPLMVASAAVMAAGISKPHRGLVAVPAVGLAAVALAAAGVLDAGGHPRRPAPPAPGVAATILVGHGPDGVAVDTASGAVLVSNSRDGTVSRIDPTTNRVAGRPLRAGRDPDGIAARAGLLLVAASGEDRVRQLGGRRAIQVGDGPEGISLRGELAWVASVRAGTVSRIDPATATRLGPAIRVGAEPTGIFAGPERVWVTNKADGTVSVIDSATARVIGAPIRVGRAPRGVVEGAGAVWVANAGDDTVVRLDPRTGARVGAPIAVGDDPRDIAFGEGFVWVSNHGDGTVSRIDPRSGRVAGAPLRVGHGPLGIAAGAGAVWVANYDDGTVTRIDPR